MPTAPKKPCPVPGCRALTEGGRCAPHRQAYERQRGSATARGLGAEYQRKRLEAIERDEGICYLCGLPGADSADHVTPRVRGGDSSDDNLRATHLQCNLRKGAR